MATNTGPDRVNGYWLSGLEAGFPTGFAGSRHAVHKQGREHQPTNGNFSTGVVAIPLWIRAGLALLDRT